MTRLLPLAAMTLAVLVPSSSAVAQGATSSATAGGGNPPYTAADVQFMRGMIVHHEQAVLIAGWAPSHSAGASLRVLCERIVVAQQDEIALMRTWLRERHEDVPSAEPHDHQHARNEPSHAHARNADPRAAGAARQRTRPRVRPLVSDVHDSTPPTARSPWWSSCCGCRAPPRTGGYSGSPPM